MSMISEERIKTNHMLLTELDMWDDFSIKSINDEWTLRYYNIIMNLLNSQVDEAIKWLDSDDAKELFGAEVKYQSELFRDLEDEWDSILEGKYSNVEELLEEVYNRGKAKGYADMREHIRFSDTDKLALEFVRGYNFHLITKIDKDTRNQIKNTITSAVISGENPRKVAPKIMDTVGTRLAGSTFTPMQRAVMIARTEISRVQNTGMLQSYVNEGYTEVKILTAEDDNVCYTCLTYAFEFNEDTPVIFENHGEEKIHNILELIKGEKFPPFHPNCRCTYLSVWETKGKSGSNDDILAISIYDSPSYFKYYNAPKDAKPIVIDEDILENELEGIVDEEDIPSFLELVKKFNDTTLNCDYEWGIGETTKGYSPEKARTDWSKISVKLHDTLKNLTSPEKLLISIHNHIWGMPILPSDKDLKVYNSQEVKYGVITNEMGMLVFRNNNKTKLSKEKMDDLFDKLDDIDVGIVEKFESDKGIIFDKTNDNHRYLLNEYVKENIDFWVDEYASFLSDDFNIEVKFINAKKHNNK